MVILIKKILNVFVTDDADWGYRVRHTEKICRLKSHRLCIILVDRLESRLNIMSLLIEEYDR